MDANAKFNSLYEFGMLSSCSEAFTALTSSSAAVKSSPHIHAWIENATLSNPKGDKVKGGSYAKREASVLDAAARHSPEGGGPPSPGQTRSPSHMRGPIRGGSLGGAVPRSEAGGSTVYSHNT